MKRRVFLAALGGAAATWPLAARAQKGERMRHIGVLLNATANDSEYQAWLRAFLQEMARLGWDIRNVGIDTRWATANAVEIRRHAEELAALSPDVILASGGSTVAPLLQATRTVPIVFPVTTDPVAAGFVESLARPGGNATGFMNFEYNIGEKWVELLKDIAPATTRVAVLWDPALPSGPAQFNVIKAAASSLGLEASPIDMRNDSTELEHGVAEFARAPNGGLVVTALGAATLHRRVIITLAARYKLPAVYFERFFVAEGGLVSYGPSRSDMYRQAALYVDRILKGEKPADLPVQPTRFDLVLNLKTARTLGLELPPSARLGRRGDR